MPTVPRLAIEGVRTVGQAVLNPLERRLRVGQHLQAPPIFIVGAPRSGTSLVYELLVAQFRFAYFANIAHRFPNTPVAATWLGRSLIHRWHGTFSSRFGHIKGWGAPNEGGWIWRRWLQDGDWQDERDVSRIDIASLGATTAAISEILRAPFINKNVMHSNRMRLINAIWPNALFIEVRRDALANARSIIRAERAHGGPPPDQDNWWSVRPSIAARYLRASEATRAVAQVLGVRHDIARDASALGHDRLFRLELESVVSDPAAALTITADWLRKHGIGLASRGAALPSLSYATSKLLSEDDELELRRSMRMVEDALSGMSV